MAAPVTFATLLPPNQNLSLFDQMFAWLAQYAVTPTTATGTNSITLTPQAAGPTITATNAGQVFSFTAANTSTGAVTITLTGVVGAFPVYLTSSVQAGSGDIVAGVKYLAFWDPTLAAGSGGYQVVPSVSEGAWISSFVPVVTPGSGAITTVSATAQYLKIGKLVTIQGQIVVTTNGTGATNIQATLPFATPNVAGTTQILNASNITTSNANIGQIAPNTSTVIITKYDGTYPVASAQTLVFAGSYQTA